MGVLSKETKWIKGKIAGLMWDCARADSSLLALRLIIYLIYLIHQTIVSSYNTRLMQAQMLADTLFCFFFVKSVV